MTGHAKQQASPLFPWLRRGLIALAANVCMLTAAQNILWSEEFDYTSAPDSDVWSYDIGAGGWGNSEYQTYTDDAANAWVNGSNLVIRAVRSGNSFTSARIRTQNKLTFQYGTVEARIKTPDLANGLWPAFWTLGNLWNQGEGWPLCGEIDVMEMGSGGAISAGLINRRVGSALHWGTDNASRTYESGSRDMTSDIDGTFVIYRMEWTPTSITTYINNQPIFSKNISSLPYFQKPHFFILNLAVGGTYTGITGSNIGNITATFPAEYVVDYIRIFDNQHTILGGTYPNNPPVFQDNPINRPNADEDSAYSATITGSASDADGNSLTYAKVPDSGPAWLNMATNGTLSGIPGNDDVGPNSWTVKVFDGHGGTDTATLNITVNDTNDDPTFFLPAFMQPNALEDSPYSMSIAGTASDVDVGDIVSYSKLSGPAWLNVATNGILTGTPLNEDVGLNSWTMQASDGKGGTGTATINITVDNVNDAPVFATDPIIMPNGVEGSLYSSPVVRTMADSASDVDEGSTLTYSKISGPNWLTVRTGGILSGRPGAADVGLNSWIVQVSDGIADPVTATLEIAVFSTTPPTLKIQASGSNLEILWPASYTTFSLYGSTNLSPPATWSSVTNTPVIQGDEWMVSLPIAGAPDYFRLEAP